MLLQAFGPDGKPTDPNATTTPIFVQQEPKVLTVIGTGFYIARYGLFLTAKHVIDELMLDEQTLAPAMTWYWAANEPSISFRPILWSSYPTAAPFDAPDIAICQAVDAIENDVPIIVHANERIGLSTQVPVSGDYIATFAYPDNARLDFDVPDKTATIRADPFIGQMREVVGVSQPRMLKYAHFETSIEVRGGASGGPMFFGGHAVAVNCRGWEHAPDSGLDHLSAVVPIASILDMSFRYPVMPKTSAEERLVPENRRGLPVTLRDLAAWRHITIDRPRVGPEQ